MKKLFLMLCLACGLSTITYAQQDNNVPFEGDLFYSSLENIDRCVEALSGGMVCNGKRHTVYTIKGDKILFKDKSFHYTVMLDPQANTVILYFDAMEKGIQCPYDVFKNSYYSSFTKEGPSTMGTKAPPTKYHFEPTGETSIFRENTAQRIKGNIETPSATTDFDLYVIPFNVSQSIYQPQMGGLEIDGLITKLSYVQENDIPALGLVKPILKRWGINTKDVKGGKLKAYCGYELKDIVYRTVNDAEFIIEGNIEEIDDMSKIAFAVINLYTENRDYLKANNMYPEQITEDVIYDINEEWEY